MDLGEFTILLAINFNLYVYYLIFSFFIYLTVYKNYYKGILDPFIFFFIFVFAFCFTNILFLFHLGEISFFYFSNFIICQISFFIGYSRFKSYNSKLKLNTSIDKPIRKKNSKIYIYFFTSLISFIILQPIVYIVSGIPLFMQSRWETFDGSGGLGLIDRLLDVIRFILAFTTFWIFFTFKKSVSLYILLFFSFLFLVGTSILNGSKMAILDYVFILSFVHIAFKANGWNVYNLEIKNVQKILFILSFFGAFYAIIVHYTVNNVEFGLDANDYTNPIYGFLLRFVYSGDVYIMAYPNNVLEKFQWYNPFIGMFRNVIGMLRIIPWDQIPKDIGFTLYDYFNPNSDIPRGPTMKFDIFGLFFFNYFGSIIFSFLVGLILSYVTNLKLRIKASFTHYLAYSLVVYYLYLLPINPPVAISKLFNVFLFFLLFRYVYKLIKNSGIKKYAL
jgi:oligosaccharide repeat unit polymerase